MHPPGTILRNPKLHNNPHAWDWIIVGPNKARRWNTTNQLKPDSDFENYDVIGHLPPDQLHTAREWRNEYAVPTKFEPGVTFFWADRPSLWGYSPEVECIVTKFREFSEEHGGDSWFFRPVNIEETQPGTWISERDLKEGLVYLHRRLPLESLEQPATESPKLSNIPTLKPGDRFRFRSMPEQWESNFRGPEHIWEVKDNCPLDIELLSSTEPKPSMATVQEQLEQLQRERDEALTTKKGDAHMSMFKFRWLGKVGKYAALFALFSIFYNPVFYWESARDWWNAPTALELGDWTRVHSCDSCRHVLPDQPDTNALCPSCGGESFSERKAQSLWEPTIRGDDTYDKIYNVRGYIYPDGSTSPLAQGHWLVPEREVNSN